MLLKAFGVAQIGSAGEEKKLIQLVLFFVFAGENVRPGGHVGKNQLVHAASGADVSTVIIGGRIVMRERKLLTCDVNRVMAEVNRRAEEFRDTGRWAPPA